MAPASRYVAPVLALLLTSGVLAACGSSRTDTRASLVSEPSTFSTVAVAAATDEPTATEQPTDVPTEEPTATVEVIVEPTPTDTPAPIDTPTPEPIDDSPDDLDDGPNVIIEFIYYDGDVPQVESDEYAVITNVGDAAQNMAGWRLNAEDDGQDFYFPTYILDAGASCRVYTNEAHPETCGFSFNIGSAIWRNKGECGYLYDANGVEVSKYCF